MRLFCNLFVLSFVTFSCSTAGFAQRAATDKAPATIDVLGEGTLVVPEAFRQGQPRSRIVQAEFVASAGEGDDKATARVYGMASGGGVEPNVRRWKDQFTDSPEGAFQRESMTVGDWKIEIVDHAGSFKDSMGGGPFAPGKTVIRDDHAMTGAILENKAGRLFFLKMIGPADVVKANRKDFIKMIKTIGDEN